MMSRQFSKTSKHFDKLMFTFPIPKDTHFQNRENLSNSPPPWNPSGGPAPRPPGQHAPGRRRAADLLLTHCLAGPSAALKPIWHLAFCIAMNK